MFDWVTSIKAIREKTEGEQVCKNVSVLKSPKSNCKTEKDLHVRQNLLMQKIVNVFVIVYISISQIRCTVIVCKIDQRIVIIF